MNSWSHVAYEPHASHSSLAWSTLRTGPCSRPRRSIAARPLSCSLDWTEPLRRELTSRLSLLSLRCWSSLPTYFHFLHLVSQSLHRSPSSLGSWGIAGCAHNSISGSKRELRSWESWQCSLLRHRCCWSVFCLYMLAALACQTGLEPWWLLAADWVLCPFWYLSR